MCADRRPMDGELQMKCKHSPDHIIRIARLVCKDEMSYHLNANKDDWSLVIRYSAGKDKLTINHWMQVEGHVMIHRT